MLFSLFHLILHLLLSRTGTAFAVAHDKPSRQYFLLCENQRLINSGFLEVIYLFFIPDSASR